MMQVQINADVFVRFANLARNLPPSDPRDYLRSVMIEVANGNAFIVSTDSRFMAVQRLGELAGEFRACIVADDVLTAQVRAEMPFSSSLFVSHEKVTTSLGFMYPGQPFISPPPGKINELFKWRDLLRVKVDQNNGTMFINAPRMRALIETSPSGRVLFPPKIDIAKPIVVKDAIDPDWLGVFLGRTEDAPLSYGSLPEWFNV